MKKILLSASFLMLSATAFTVAAQDIDITTHIPAKDNAVYAAKDGFTCENLWIFDRFHDLIPVEGEEAPAVASYYELSPICSQQSRTATTDGENVYVIVNGASGAGTDGGYGQAIIYAYDLMTGAFVKQIPLTLNGAAYEGQLAANTIGFDSYGHMFVAPYIGNSDGSGALNVYLVDKETGALALAGELSCMGGIGRIDYVDVVGDLTGVEARCDLMAASSSQTMADKTTVGGSNVFWWALPKGATTWQGGFSTGLSWLEVKGFYPESMTDFGNASTATIVRSAYSETDGVQMFYAEGNNTLATLYGTDGSIIDSFGSVTDENVVLPNAGTNGLHEMAIGDQKFIVYSEGQYDGAHSCQAIITTVDENYSYPSIKPLWTVPETGLGQTTDGGTRIHCITSVALPEDANGREARLVLSFKCFNGMAVYRVAEEGYGSVEENFVANANITVNGDVIAVSEVAESIEVYNVAGQMVGQVENASEIAAPATGLYIVKAVVEGAPVVKKVIVK